MQSSLLSDIISLSTMKPSRGSPDAGYMNDGVCHGKILERAIKIGYLNAQFASQDMKIYFHFQPFLKPRLAQAVEMIHLGKKAASISQPQHQGCWCAWRRQGFSSHGIYLAPPPPECAVSSTSMLNTLSRVLWLFPSPQQCGVVCLLECLH